jgi:release factor glutamine methyltransferase
VSGESVTIAALLAEARAAGIDRLDAQLLVARHVGRPRGWVIANGATPVDPPALQALRADFERRAAGVPLAYLTGAKEFRGLMLRVTRDVLVPRPDTETVVDWAVELARSIDRPLVIDLGTGSGAIALAVKAAQPTAQVTASDDSDAALTVARENAASLGLDVRFLDGDWWAAVGDARFDIAVCNPPYVGVDDAHLAALVHEPQHALVGGRDGLDAIRKVIAGAAAHLKPGGWLLLEHGSEQWQAVATLLGAGGFDSVETRCDLAGLPRCTGGRRGHPSFVGRAPQ